MKINMKDFRQAHNLFQSEMAELLGVNQSNVSRAELRGYFSLTYPQLQTLYERFGREDVDSFSVDEPQVSVTASGNSNEGSGTQNNGLFHFDEGLIDVIRRQSDAITELAHKQSEQTDRLLSLLDKISEKL